MNRDHLRLVPPPKPPFKFESDLFVFAKIGDDIFICNKGAWQLAAQASEATDALISWLARIDLDDKPMPWPVTKRVPA